MKISELQTKLRKIKSQVGDKEIDQLIDHEVYALLDVATSHGHVFLVSELSKGDIKKAVKAAVKVTT